MKSRLNKLVDQDHQFIYSLMSVEARHYAWRALIYVLIGSALLIVVPYGISFYIDGLTSATTDAMMVGGLLFLSFGAFDVFVGWLRQRVRERFFQSEFWFLPQTITQRYFARPLAQLSGSDSEIDGGGVESLRDKVWSVLASYSYSIIPGYGMVIFGLGACFYAHPLVGLVATLYALLELWLGRRNNQYIQTHMRPVIDQFKRWERRMNEWWHNVDHVKCQGVETKILGMIHDEVQEALAGDDAIWRVYNAYWILLRRTLGLLLTAAVYAGVGYLVLNGGISAASGILVFFSLQRVRIALEQLSDQQREVQFNIASIAKYRRLLEKPNPFLYNEGNDFVDDSIAITFDEVTHAVDTEDGKKIILKDVSLHIPAGIKVGIVGPSGAGKSQLLSLIKRATDPISGRVLINDTDLRDLRLESFLRFCGVIMQKSEPYEDTILGNILFGLSHHDLPRAFDEISETEQATLLSKARNALHRAGLKADTFHGDNDIFTRVGYKGMRLSGGQQQRLQIAGALLKLSINPDRAKLILADEPTAALDSLSEQHVMEHFRDTLPENTTMLMVAHRLSTVVDMDCIVFVRPIEHCGDENKPQVTVHQSMSELYVSEPLFREMADAQGFTFQDEPMESVETMETMRVA